MSDQLLHLICQASAEATKPILEPILKEQAESILRCEVVSGVEAVKRFGITKHDLPYIPVFQPSVDRAKKYQVKDILAYIEQNKRSASKKKGGQ